MQRVRTAFAAAEVLTAARDFFTSRSGIYAAFLEKEGPGFITLRGQGGEEIAIGVAAVPGGTEVTGSSYLFDAQVARFLSTLPPVPVAHGVA